MMQRARGDAPGDVEEIEPGPADGVPLGRGGLWVGGER